MVDQAMLERGLKRHSLADLIQHSGLGDRKAQPMLAGDAIEFGGIAERHTGPELNRCWCSLGVRHQW